ncbi:MAG: DUF3885 domain-containing protein [Terracidiphilus sp.]|jgi:hypothetical protein
MTSAVPFDLPEFMFSHFGRVDFGGDLFEQWPVGIRFEIGIEQVDRAAQLFNFAFSKARACVLVSQDWTDDGNPAQRYTPFFKTPGIFRTEATQFQTVEVSPFEETGYRLTWTCALLQDFDAARMFQAIANREQPGFPKISSGVYVIDPSARIIMHMYDDRGLDVIATELPTLRSMFERFSEWILENCRHKVEFRFGSSAQALGE